jgi:GntR family transcriptional regulator
MHGDQGRGGTDAPTLLGLRSRRLYMGEPSYVPRYYEIEQSLRARVAKLTPGSPLPSDAELCREFAVSRMTARNAVQRLAQQGLVVREPGRGTFVAEPPAHRLANSLLSFSKEMRRQGKLPSSRLLECRLRPPNREETARLRLRNGEQVIEVRRIRLADGVAIAIERAALHPRCASAVLGVDLEGHSLHERLVAAGVGPTRGSATLRAEEANAEDAALLDVRPGAALLVERRLILDRRGLPVELTESRYAADRYALQVDFLVEDARPGRT